MKTKIPMTELRQLRKNLADSSKHRLVLESIEFRYVPRFKEWKEKPAKHWKGVMRKINAALSKRAYKAFCDLETYFDQEIEKRKL